VGISLYYFVTSEASDFKFGVQLVFVKAHKTFCYILVKTAQSAVLSRYTRVTDRQADDRHMTMIGLCNTIATFC